MLSKTLIFDLNDDTQANAFANCIFAFNLKGIDYSLRNDQFSVELTIKQ